ncbi:MAG: alpha-galactosidase [Eubacteriales bacterium]
MGIIFHEKSKEFHICNKEVSYIFCVLRNGQLGQLYYGKRLRDTESFQHLLEIATRDMAPCVYIEDRMYSMESMKQEYPTYGHGDMRYGAYQIVQEDGSRISEFVYKNHNIYAGKKKLKGLPATYVENDDEAETLEVILEDKVINTEIVLSYTIYKDRPVICRNTEFVHHGDQRIVLTNAMSMNIDLPDSNYEMITLTGMWGRERYVKQNPLHEGIQAIYSMRGHSSHEYNPFFALKRPTTTEDTGEVIGLSLVYSGNFLGQVTVDTVGVTRAMLGIHPEGFAWTLQKGERFQTPETVLVYSNDGLNGMSQAFHSLYRTRLAKGKWRDEVRPVLINNWEATYMDFDEEKILGIAIKAKELGVELLVLDDGWFGQRNSDKSSLGDWYPNLEKLPNGINGLAEKITAMDINFGLWIEPEMVNKDSELYKRHPDWIIGVPYRAQSHGRYQYVLDYSKPEVVQWIGDCISKILSGAPISYIKWDMNRSISEAFSQGKTSAEQGKLFHKHILGVYALYERLTTEYPEILFESCASGGARFDPGMLYYSPQGWTSDNTDAVERTRIQYGTSMVYPLSSMGCHVSAVPNHQTFRNTPLNTRAAVAYFGCFGYEMDLNLLSNEEQEEIKQQIELYKKHRKLMMSGTFYRMISPFENEDTAWMVVSQDQTQAIVGYYRMRQPSNAPLKRLYLEGLSEDKQYSISGRDGKFYGDELMEAGMLISDYASGIRPDESMQGDYQARLFVLETCK